MDVLVYGGGAVGLGIASCLIRPGHRVDIVARAETVAALKDEGLLRTGLFGRVHVPAGTFGCCVSLDEVARGPYDFVLICTKSFDSAAAARDLAAREDRIGTSATLVLFQNGWGNAESFAAHFDKRRIYNARVITGFHRHRPHEVEITVHADAIHIGSLFSANLSVVEPLCRAINVGGIPCESTDSIERDLWAKMLYNCALNPLGAILGVPYGALAEAASTRALMDRIVEEVFAVMVATGYQTHWREPKQFLEVFYGRLGPRYRRAQILNAPGHHSRQANRDRSSQRRRHPARSRAWDRRPLQSRRLQPRPLPRKQPQRVNAISCPR